MKTIKELADLGQERVAWLLNPDVSRPKWTYEYHINLDYLPHSMDEMVDDELELMFCFKHRYKNSPDDKLYQVEYTNVAVRYRYEEERDNYVTTIMDYKRDN